MCSSDLEDLEKQKLKFPDVEKPQALFYQLNNEEDEVFNQTIDLISNKFTYARYTPLLYYIGGKVTQPEELAQHNMGKFMKILLVKRLESSFFAFKKSIDRFIYSYKMFIEEFNKGNVYVSKRYSNKIFEFLENDDDESIQILIDEGKADKYASVDFKKTFIEDLKNDFKILNTIKSLWQKVNRDPKLLKFLDELSENKILKNNKVIIFSESKETAEYLTKNINSKFPDITLCFTGGSGEPTRNKVIDNFDARVRNPKDDYRILVSTEVLSEGVNLHRSNVVVNYDIPWNPTRMMQRVGRINRVDTKHKKIYTFNFFPTEQSNDEIKLKEAAISKINAFLTLLGGDSALLTEGEPVDSHELFNRLLSKQTITGEEETVDSELKYLQVIKKIRDKDHELFNRLKYLPKKSRTAKTDSKYNNSLLTYFRRGKLQKFFISDEKLKTFELDFITAAKILESNVNEKKRKLSPIFYELLDKNKEAAKNLFGLNESTKDFSSLIGDVGAEMDGVNSSSEDSISAIQKLREEAKGLADNSKETKDAMQEIADLSLNFEGLGGEFEGLFDESFFQGINESGKNFSEQFKGGLKDGFPVVDQQMLANNQKLFEQSDLFLCEGPFMANSLIKLGCLSTKVTIQHLGINIDEFPYQPRKWHPGEPLRVLITASFREKKGIPFALKALGKLNDKVKLKITIIGDSNNMPGSHGEKTKILETIQKEKLNHKVRMLGYQPYRILIKEAYNHHIFLSPSITANDGDTEGGAPVTIIEMMASGMPVVSTNHCDIPEVVHYGVNNWLVDERDVIGLVERMQWLIENSSEWNKILDVGRKHIETEFDARIQGKKLANIYKSCINR